MRRGNKIDIRCCDNLELMAEIEDNTVDLIYCDVLYGTGRKFTDYQDLKPKREIIEEHYIPRIKEMHRILKDTGSIYLQMDTKINHWLRCILDDVFGYGNFLNEIIWWYYNSQSNVKNNYKSKHDNILYYKKSNKYTFNLNDIGLNYNEKQIKRFSKEDENGKYYNNVTQQGKKVKVYFDDKKVINLQNVWDIPISQKTEYSTQKPKALIERIIKASSNEGDLVADFYAGSFTTAEVCKDLNRSFIGCDISETAVEIGLKRVNKIKIKPFFFL